MFLHIFLIRSREVRILRSLSLHASLAVTESLSTMDQGKILHQRMPLEPANASLATRKSGTSDSPVLGNNSRLVRHRKTLQDLWASLPSSHQAILDHFLKKLTMQELHRLQERLRTVGNHQLSRFTSMLCNASSEQFLRYLRFFTAPPYHWENDSPTSGMPSAAIIVHNAARLGNDNTPLSGAIIRSSNMYRVPQELFDMVLNDLFRTVFVPGTLHPGAFPFFDGPDCFADKSFNLNKSRTFRSLDIVRYNRYKDAYWSQNTWVRLPLDYFTTGTY